MADAEEVSGDAATAAIVLKLEDMFFSRLRQKWH